MKFLFCSHNPLDLRLGAPKALIETAAALERLGHTCRLVSDVEIEPNIRSLSGTQKIKKFSSSLANFLNLHAKDYDIVDYEHLYLPFERNRFSNDTLFVARSVLLTHHFEKIPLPRYRRLRSWIGHLLKNSSRTKELQFSILSANQTFKNSDLIKVNNDHDRIELIRREFDPEKIVVIADGISEKRLSQFQKNATAPIPNIPKIAFVGTFDLRKGAREFPEIVKATVEKIPNCKFKLMGSRYLSNHEVMSFFPKKLHPHLEVINEFDPESLPDLLKDCSLGIFPSYIEGFGIGVLEMLAASLPVIAYDSPGPPMMLPQEWLVPRGNHKMLVKKLVELLNSPKELEVAREWSRVRAQSFTWEAAAKSIVEHYSSHLEKLRKK